MGAIGAALGIIGFLMLLFIFPPLAILMLLVGAVWYILK
jgi:heme O synthase-like polyprenyltransferase